jgi:hypothetical protein
VVHSEISQEKIKAYEATHYCAGTGPDTFVLWIGQHSPELAQLYLSNDSNCALFITAFNPLGKAQDDEANEAAHARLGEVLRALVADVIEGAGADPACQWPPEKSYLALGINAEVARDLGRRFMQDAVVWIGEDAVPQLLLLR